MIKVRRGFGEVISKSYRPSYLESFTQYKKGSDCERCPRSRVSLIFSQKCSQILREVRDQGTTDRLKQTIVRGVRGDDKTFVRPVH